jgi:hypothetical protein
VCVSNLKEISTTKDIALYWIQENYIHGIFFQIPLHTPLGPFVPLSMTQDLAHLSLTQQWKTCNCQVFNGKYKSIVEGNSLIIKEILCRDTKILTSPNFAGHL